MVHPVHYVGVQGFIMDVNFIEWCIGYTKKWEWNGKFVIYIPYEGNSIKLSITGQPWKEEYFFYMIHDAIEGINREAYKKGRYGAPHIIQGFDSIKIYMIPKGTQIEKCKIFGYKEFGSIDGAKIAALKYIKEYSNEN